MKHLRVLLWGVVLSWGLLGCQPAGGTEVNSTETGATETGGTESSPVEPATSTPEADLLLFNVGEVFTLGGGQEALVGEGLRIRFAEVLEDSRCPTEVECFWTGQARIAVVVQEGENEAVTVEFNTNPAPDQNRQTAEVGPYTIELQSLDPYPATPDDGTTFEEYRAALVVRKGSGDTTGQIVLGEPFTLAGGQEAVIPGAGWSLRFDEVPEDSRCPRQVQCVEAGQARILLIVQVEGFEPLGVEFVMNPAFGPGATTGAVGGYEFELLSLDPYPETTEGIAFEEYQATLVVSQVTPPPEFRLGAPFTLDGGEEAANSEENLWISFDAIVEESRCPTQVTCVWAGQARISVRLKVGEGEPVRVILNSNAQAGETTAEVGEYTITLQSLEPHPVTPDEVIELEEYRATVVVTKG